MTLVIVQGFVDRDAYLVFKKKMFVGFLLKYGRAFFFLKKKTRTKMSALSFDHYLSYKFYV